MVSSRGTTPMFLIDLAASSVSVDDAKAVHQALEEASKRMVARGADVRMLVSVFVPADQRWICVFTADDEEVARRTADMAQIPERHVRAGSDLRTVRAHTCPTA
jgi:hypothetical protein